MEWKKGCAPGFPHWGPRFGHHFKEMGKMMALRFPEWFDKIKAFVSTYVAEDEEYITVEIDMPGFEKDNIDLKAGDYYLEVSAEREHSEEEIKLRGTEKKTFKANVNLPSKAKVDEVKATYTNGVLRVVLKKEPEKSVEVD
nr:Hsp20/alpha crystallin family protein [Candidatus Freyarchaeota archaeon]